jgi:acyl-CoA thioester hydrolase
MTATGGPVTFGLRVRYHECDMQGIVFNATYLAYADIASFELWRAVCGSYAEIPARGYETPVVSAQLAFRSPARHDDELTVDIGVSRMGSTSVELTTTLRRDAEHLAQIAVTYVFVDKETFASKPPPDDIRAALLRYERSD